jgi:hypothetical protein
MATDSALTSSVAVIGLVIAIYGAVLSTFVYRRDRVEVVIKVRRNMSIAVNRSADPFLGLMNVKFVVVTATNKGKRPVSIQAFALRLLDSNTELLLDDVSPRLPRAITEGETITAKLREDHKQLAYAECYYVWDSVGRHFRLNVVPWYRILLSRYRRRFSPVKR